jgi:RNA polymerase sigma-70 factor (ECF subfamily)
MRLLGGAKAGDVDQLENWLAEGYARSYRTAYLILHNRQDAEEAVQEAFLRAWRFRDAVPEGDGVKPWMYRVVVNACLSKLRSERAGRERTSPLDPDTADNADRQGRRDEDPLESTEMGETQRAVLAALAALPDHLRAVVVLRFYIGLTETEIAEVIRRRPGTVKSRIHEAKLVLGRDPALSIYQPNAVLAEGSVQ